MRQFFLALAILLTPLNCFAASEGPNSPTAGSITSDNSNGESDVWSNLDNVVSDDLLESEVGLDGLDTSQYLNAQNFDFSIPVGATIDGITAEIDVNIGAGTQCRGDAWDTTVKLVKGGVISGDNKATSTTPPGTYKTYGGAADLWGETWTNTDINATDFGVVFAYTEQDDDNCDVEVDHIRITVHYTPAVVPVPDLGEWAMIVMIGVCGYFLYSEGLFHYSQDI